MSRSKSSDRWLARQRRDPFARRAAAEGQASRAHFKLEQLDRRCGLLRPGMRVLELGAAPGGWTRYLEQRLQSFSGDGSGSGSPRSLLVACDPRPVSAGADTVVIESAYGESATDVRLGEVLGGAGVELVLSDMAPNMSGNRIIDQARAMELADLALDAAERWLKPGGDLVVKMFHGAGLDSWVAAVRKKFAHVRLVKPAASRAGSREVYAVARAFARRA